MSFLRHGEIYPSDGGAIAVDHAPSHRLDEFPAGYSLAGWSPPEPASASPTDSEYALKSYCRSTVFQRTANSVLTVCVRLGGKRRQRRDCSSLNRSWLLSLQSATTLITTWALPFASTRRRGSWSLGSPVRMTSTYPARGTSPTCHSTITRFQLLTRSHCTSEPKAWRMRVKFRHCCRRLPTRPDPVPLDRRSSAHASVQTPQNS